VDLDWSAPPECPGRSYVLGEVARLVGPAAAAATRAPVKARAVVSRGNDARFRVVITTFDEEAGEREMFAPSCHALADAIALVIALRVDPTLLDRPPAPAPIRTSTSPPEPVPSAQTAPPAEAMAPPASTPPTPPPVRVVPSREPAKPSADPARAPLASRDQLALGASFASSVGDLPRPSVGAEVIAAWLHDRLRFELRGASALAQRADVAGRSGVGGSVQTVSAGARGCYGLLAGANGGPIGLAACVEGELDWMWVAGYGANPLAANAGWAALGGGLIAQWNLGRRLAFRASLDALAPLTRPSFVIDDAAGGTALVHRPGVAVGRLALGVEIHFF